MVDLLNYPFDPHELLRKKKSLKRELSETGSFVEKRIAILGGSTTAEVQDMLELFLLHAGIRPIYYQSEYNKYFEDIMFENEPLDAFKPDIIYIHTTTRNITSFPEMGATAQEVDGLLDAQYAKFRDVWQQIDGKYRCAIIQNNFELPPHRPLGNLDAYDFHGRTQFVNRLNQYFVDYAASHKNFYLQDIHYLSSWLGLQSWYSTHHWHSYKYAMAVETIPTLAHNLASIMQAIWGMARKCLVLDLDNTLWGGVIGEDGPANIKIGKETAEAETFHDLQTYVKELKERGILLAVCSKNEMETAKQGFRHRDSVLKFEDFTAFKANWEPKSENIRLIAKDVNIGEDALVLLDDNPAERSIVRSQVSSVAVPELGDDPGNFINIIDKSGYFETVALSTEDTRRNQYYEDDIKRQETVAKFKNYREFLDSLEMIAEIGPFSIDCLERVTQLINKTNQFNLTTRRYTAAQLQAIIDDPAYISLYARLADKFGDNGIVSCLIGHIQSDELHIDLWLMSCRVLKRDLEQVIFDELKSKCQALKLKTIVGYFFKTPKNDMVSHHYKLLGFRLVSTQENGDGLWSYSIAEPNVEDSSRAIRVVRK